MDSYQWWVLELVLMGTCWIDLCQCLDICVSCIHQSQKELSLTCLGKGRVVLLHLNLGVDPVPTLHMYLAKTEVGVRRKDLKWEAPTPTKHLLILVK